MIRAMTDHIAAIREATDAYRQAQAAMVEAQASLVQAMREAYAARFRKSEIMRATDHLWSRTWLDRTLDGPREPAHHR